MAKPSGPYYDRWLALDDVGDYYPWLSEQFDGADPWASWAKSAKGEVRKAKREG